MSYGCENRLARYDWRDRIAFNDSENSIDAEKRLALITSTSDSSVKRNRVKFPLKVEQILLDFKINFEL